MRIVLVASEAVPWAKTGGLADVAGALPEALAELGHDVTLILPHYRAAARVAPHPTSTPWRYQVPLGGGHVEGGVSQGVSPHGSVRVLFIDQPQFFDREGIYSAHGADFPDNPARFLFFSRAAIEAMRLADLRPDIIHVNDWHTGILPVYLREYYAPFPEVSRAAIVMTIHNLAYQGRYGQWVVPLAELPWHLFDWRALEFYGQFNFLKAGMAYAQKITTVSPTYADEIQTPDYGHGLDPLLRHRADDLTGIVNGVDTDVWNPRTDSQIARRYDERTFTEGKAACKQALQRDLGLPVRADIPLLAQIGRLDPQKGWDLLLPVASEMLKRDDAQFVVLGTGQWHFQEALTNLEKRFPKRLRAIMQFSPTLAHQIEAAADFFLMPSLYEPCGLNQIYSQIYGTIPIVRRTGGLADTVIDPDDATKERPATGIVFEHADQTGLRWAIERGLKLWKDQPVRDAMIKAGMTRDWSWRQSAVEYLKVYEAASAAWLNRPTE
jgi:starch synthase